MKLSNVLIVVALFIIFNTNDNQTLAKHSSVEPSATCLLYSDVFYEYLYAANFMFSKYFKRTVYTWRPVNYLFGSRFDTHLAFSESDRKAVWFFEPVEGMKDVFYIKNMRYNEYLYTSQYHVSLFMPQRLVYTNDRVKPEWRESYMWRMEKENDKGRFIIWNVKYNEPLYPSLQKHTEKGREEPRRDVFTWPLRKDQAPSSFYWTLKCKNDIYPVALDKPNI